VQPGRRARGLGGTHDNRDVDSGPAGFAEFKYPIHPRLTLFDIIGTAQVDGEAGVTYAEMSWPPDYIDDRKGLVRP
jgi:hypothetical protein